MINYAKETLEVLRDIKELLKIEILKPRKEAIVENFDNVIKDSTSGLMWDKNGSDKEMTFVEAEKYCKDLNLGDFNDWRLPTRIELLTLVDDTRYNPAIKSGFNSKSDYYWTSTPFAGDSDDFWIVLFYDGNVHHYLRYNNFYVRPVRPVNQVLKNLRD